MESLDVTHDGFFNGRRVLITGHTGFKGSWLALILQRLGARVAGYSLDPSSAPNLFRLCQPWTDLRHEIADVRDASALYETVRDFDPEVIIHMAAQALVRESYRDPVTTFSTNIMGTVNLLAALRAAPSLRVALIVTSDKVYRNSGTGRRYREGDPLGGGDPYSASKACAEIVASSFPVPDGDALAVATARAGNVVGGGDWSKDRLIPDFIRSLESGTPLALRYPNAVRPWQHVLDVVNGYLRYIVVLSRPDGNLPRAMNFGPVDENSPTVADVAETLANAFGVASAWRRDGGDHAPEASSLQLDVALAERHLDWRPRLSLEETMDWTARWYRRFRDGANARAMTLSQIDEYEQRPCP